MKLLFRVQKQVRGQCIDPCCVFRSSLGGSATLGSWTKGIMELKKKIVVARNFHVDFQFDRWRIIYFSFFVYFPSLSSMNFHFNQLFLQEMFITFFLQTKNLIQSSKYKRLERLKKGSVFHSIKNFPKSPFYSTVSRRMTAAQRTEPAATPLLRRRRRGPAPPRSYPPHSTAGKGGLPTLFG